MENRGGDIDIDEPGCADQTRPQTETLGTKYVEMEEIDFCPYSPSPEEKAFFEAVRSGNSAEVEEMINVKHVECRLHKCQRGNSAINSSEEGNV